MSGFDNTQPTEVRRPPLTEDEADTGKPHPSGSTRVLSGSVRPRNRDAISRVFADFVPQRANGHSEHTRRRGTVSIGAGKCLEHEIAFDVSDG
jgi:hypothetical protein